MARKKQTFDEAMERLEEIVEQLEQEEVSLETAVSLYKEGLSLAAPVVCGVGFFTQASAIVSMA